MSSYTDAGVHTGASFSFTLSWATADPGSQISEATFTVPGGLFDPRYRLWRLSCDIVTLGVPQVGLLETNSFQIALSTVASGGVIAGPNPAAVGTFTLIHREQIVASVNHWGDANNDRNPSIQTTQCIILNPAGQQLRVRLIDAYDNFATAPAGSIFDVAAPAGPVNGGQNYWSLVFSAAPVLNMTLNQP